MVQNSLWTGKSLAGSRLDVIECLEERRWQSGVGLWFSSLDPVLYGSGDKKYAQKSAQDGSGLGIVTHKASWRNETLPA